MKCFIDYERLAPAAACFGARLSPRLNYHALGALAPVLHSFVMLSRRIESLTKSNNSYNIYSYLFSFAVFPSSGFRLFRFMVLSIFRDELNGLLL